jgi:hypothetical protein
MVRDGVTTTKESGDRAWPVVLCPGCKLPMTLQRSEPATEGLQTATYKCERCGTETKREFKRE